MLKAACKRDEYIALDALVLTGDWSNDFDIGMRDGLFEWYKQYGKGVFGGQF